MKSKSILAALMISILFSVPVFAENGNHSKADASCKKEMNQASDQTTLDKIQKETEQISILKPVLSLAKMVEVKIEQNKQYKQNEKTRFSSQEQLNH
jgi:hypothetical protein